MAKNGLRSCSRRTALEARCSPARPVQQESVFPHSPPRLPSLLLLKRTTALSRPGQSVPCVKRGGRGEIGRAAAQQTRRQGLPEKKAAQGSEPCRAHPQQKPSLEKSNTHEKNLARVRPAASKTATSGRNLPRSEDWRAGPDFSHPSGLAKEESRLAPEASRGPHLFTYIKMFRRLGADNTPRAFGGGNPPPCPHLLQPEDSRLSFPTGRRTAPKGRAGPGARRRRLSQSGRQALPATLGGGLTRTVLQAGRKSAGRHLRAPLPARGLFQGFLLPHQRAKPAEAFICLPGQLTKRMSDGAN